MATLQILTMIEAAEQLLLDEELSERIEHADKKLLNAVEALAADEKSLADEVERLKAQLEQQKKAKTTSDSKAAITKLPTPIIPPRKRDGNTNRPH